MEQDRALQRGCSEIILNDVKTARVERGGVGVDISLSEEVKQLC